MRVIKEKIKESIRLQKQNEFLEDFESGNPEDFVKRGDLIELLTILITVLNDKIDKGN